MTISVLSLAVARPFTHLFIGEHWHNGTGFTRLVHAVTVVEGHIIIGCLYSFTWHDYHKGLTIN